MEKQILNLKTALELVDGDEELLNILLETFVNETHFEKEKVLGFVNANNFIEGAKYVHATKGAGRQLCAERLAEAGQNLEDVLRGKTTGDIPSLTDKMYEEYLLAMDAIKKALAK